MVLSFLRQLLRKSGENIREVGPSEIRLERDSDCFARETICPNETRLKDPLQLEPPPWGVDSKIPLLEEAPALQLKPFSVKIEITSLPIPGRPRNPSFFHEDFPLPRLFLRRLLPSHYRDGSAARFFFYSQGFPATRSVKLDPPGSRSIPFRAGMLR